MKLPKRIVCRSLKEFEKYKNVKSEIATDDFGLFLQILKQNRISFYDERNTRIVNFVILKLNDEYYHGNATICTLNNIIKIVRFRKRFYMAI